MANKKYSKKYSGSFGQKIDVILLLGFILFAVGYSVFSITKDSPVLLTLSIVGSICCLWGVVVLFKKLKERKYRKIKNIQDMQNMRRRDFELFIEYVFRKNGYKAQVRSGNQDGGVDVDAKKWTEKIVVQCKKWSWEKVGVEKLREFYGVINMAWVTKGIFVTTSELTEAAQKEYEKMKDKLEVWDKNNLEQYVEEFVGRK